MRTEKTTLLLLLVVLTALITDGLAQQLRRGREIPSATLAASTDEANWWEELRKAAEEVRDKRDSKKAREAFMQLLMVGQQMNYGAPVEDRKPTPIRQFEPQYTEAARRARMRGTVSMKVECRADGFVGEIEIIKGLGSELDNQSIEAARKLVFLPAVKDRKFVTGFLQMEMGFDLY
jgi:TonB family protein